jgi:hypothetical protein
MTTASQRFNTALITIASKGLCSRCSDVGTGGLWLSEREAERAEACKLCRGCPVILECAAAADERDERFGVWSGRDYSVRPGRPKNKP